MQEVSSSSRLAGRRVLVTGAERGIGRAVAIGCAAAGADVGIHYVDSAADADEVVTIVRAQRRNAVAIRADLSDRAQASMLIKEAEEALGAIDVLVNNAGVLVRRAFLETTVEDLDLTLAVDLVAPFLLSQLVARRLVALGTGGSIINITSVSQERAAPGLAAYQAAKAAMWMLTRGLALELAPHGIRVNSVAPGTTVTALNRDLLAQPGVAAQRLGSIPLGRFGEPQDHVGAVIFYASDESSWVTGTSLVVDGGITLR